MPAGLVASAWAGTLRNEDRQVYKYVVHWEDLEPAVSGEILPGQKLDLRDAAATIELVGKRDSIYMRPGERIVIAGGILRSLDHPIED